MTTKYKVPDDCTTVPFSKVFVGESFRFANDQSVECIKVGRVIYEKEGRQYNVNAVNRKCIVKRG